MVSSETSSSRVGLGKGLKSKSALVKNLTIPDNEDKDDRLPMKL